MILMQHSATLHSAAVTPACLERKLASLLRENEFFQEGLDDLEVLAQLWPKEIHHVIVKGQNFCAPGNFQPLGDSFFNRFSAKIIRIGRSL